MTGPAQGRAILFSSCNPSRKYDATDKSVVRRAFPCAPGLLGSDPDPLRNHFANGGGPNHRRDRLRQPILPRPEINPCASGTAAAKVSDAATIKRNFIIALPYSPKLATSGGI